MPHNTDSKGIAVSEGKQNISRNSHVSTNEINQIK